MGVGFQEQPFSNKNKGYGSGRHVNNQHIGLSLDHQEGAQHHNIQDNRREQHKAVGVNLLAQIAEHAPMHGDIHDDIKNCAERCDPAQIKEYCQEHRQPDRIDQRVFLNAARHAENGCAVPASYL